MTTRRDFTMMKICFAALLFLTLLSGMAGPAAAFSGSAGSGIKLVQGHPGQWPMINFERAPVFDPPRFLAKNANSNDVAALFVGWEGKWKSKGKKNFKKFFRGHKNRTRKDRPEASRYHFHQDVISGSVDASLQGGGFVLHLELSPITAFVSESPGLDAGTITTEAFFNGFAEIFGDMPPNSILTLRGSGGTGTAISVPMALRSPFYDPLTGMVEFIATPLEHTPGLNSSGTAVEVQSVEELESPFGLAFLFINGGSFDPFGGPCGDGANLVCPGFDQCLNRNTSPFCCDLGGEVSCDFCAC